jgi:hypothetical protein
MILENDYNLGLFNGDVGIALPADGSCGSFFPAPRTSSPSLRPACPALRPATP